MRGRHPAFAARSNLDYSWTRLGKNCYGLLEVHDNRLGHRPPLAESARSRPGPRLARGEVFPLGTAYVAGTRQMEFHPLLDGFVTAIADLDGPSAVLQPRLT